MLGSFVHFLELLSYLHMEKQPSEGKLETHRQNRQVEPRSSLFPIVDKGI